MPRRKRTAFNPVVLIGLIALAALAVGGFFLFKTKKADPFDGVTKLEPESYLENSTSFSGNVYQITATVSRQLKWTDKGRLFSMAAKNPKGGDAVDVPVFFPATFASDSINVGQEMNLKVKVDRSGLLEVLAKN